MDTFLRVPCTHLHCLTLGKPAWDTLHPSQVTDFPSTEHASSQKTSGERQERFPQSLPFTQEAPKTHNPNRSL